MLLVFPNKVTHTQALISTAEFTKDSTREKGETIHITHFTVNCIFLIFPSLFPLCSTPCLPLLSLLSSSVNLFHVNKWQFLFLTLQKQDLASHCRVPPTLRASLSNKSICSTLVPTFKSPNKDNRNELKWNKKKSICQWDHYIPHTFRRMK